MPAKLVEHGLAAVGRNAEETNARTFGEQALARLGQPRFLETHHDDIGAGRVNELGEIDVADSFSDERDAALRIETSTNDVAKNAWQIDDQNSLVRQ